MSEPMQADPPTTAPRRRWKRWIIAGAVAFVVLPLAGYAALTLYNRERAERDLQQAIAEADESDPKWRLEDIESKRLALPMKSNAAGPALYASKAMPPKWVEFKEAADFERLPPQRQLSPAITTALQQRLKPLRATVVVRAREAMKHGQGWCLVEWSPDYIGTLVPHLEKVRD